MSYYQGLDLVMTPHNYEELDLFDKALIKSVKESVTDSYNAPMFDMWLTHDADHNFGLNYINIFKKHYGIHITTEIENRLWFASKNIIYAIRAFIYIKKHCTLDELLEFVERFLIEQLMEFCNDYEDFDFGTWKEESEQESKI
jgi:hypothetical protein